MQIVGWLNLAERNNAEVAKVASSPAQDVAEIAPSWNSEKISNADLEKQVYMDEKDNHTNKAKYKKEMKKLYSILCFITLLIAAFVAADFRYRWNHQEWHQLQNTNDHQVSAAYLAIMEDYKEKLDKLGPFLCGAIMYLAIISFGHCLSIMIAFVIKAKIVEKEGIFGWKKYIQKYPILIAFKFIWIAMIYLDLVSLINEFSGVKLFIKSA